MTYTITYRRKDGQRETMTLDSASRQELFAELMRRGVIAISVREGAIRCAARSASRRTLLRVLIAGLVVVFGAVAVWRLLPYRESVLTAQSDVKSLKTIPTATPLPVAKKGSTPVPKENPLPPQRAVQLEDGVEVISKEVTTNRNGAVIEKLALADGRKKMKVHPPDPIFKNASDQVIALALSTKPGQPMPPLPNLDASLERDFLNSLETPIVVNDDDSPEAKELKSRIMETRAYLAEEVRNGGSLLAALRDHQRLMEKCADDHEMAIQMMQRLKESSGKEAAKEFIQRVNESFRERGVPEIELNENTSKGKL